ncbi:MAG: ComF family protein [Phycisphaeraceae bacterium]|nr:ComF family protein [Phycisphaeraceae bacterium]
MSSKRAFQLAEKGWRLTWYALSARHQAGRRATLSGWQADAPSAYCHRCGISAGPGSVKVEGCSYCVGRKSPWDRVVRLGSYDAPLDQWIVRMKFAQDWSWGPWLGAKLAESVGRIGQGEKAAICPVPMHWLRRWRRGYNQAELIAREISRVNKWPLAAVLRRPRLTRPQTTVSLSERLRNIQGSFDVGHVDLRGWSVWLVDDIKTTGATATACARLLRKAGAEKVYLAVAAVANPHHADFTHVEPRPTNHAASPPPAAPAGPPAHGAA